MKANEPEKKHFRTLVQEAIGEASMCWSETPKGVFDLDRAIEVADRVMKAHEEWKAGDDCRKALEGAVELIEWMTGSADFGDGGKAYQGWLKLKHKLEDAKQALRKDGE